MKTPKDAMRTCAICSKKKNFHMGYWESIDKKIDNISTKPGKGKLEWVCYLCSLGELND